MIALAAAAARGEEPAPPARVEARSSDLLAVGTVRDGRMIIHLSRLADNAPVRDAALSVVLRGAAHPAAAEADGSYSVQTEDLRLPGTAAVQFEVTRGAQRELLAGTLEAGAPPGQSDDKGSTRQLGWWVLNFAVCIGFLWLWSRRKSADT
jgi:membrane fusion protein, heavy metal efflux system